MRQPFRTGAVLCRSLGRLLGTRRFRIAFTAIAVGCAAVALAFRTEKVLAVLDGLSWTYLTGALLAVYAALGCMLMAWRELLAELGSPLPLRPAARVYFTSQLGKYVPGSVWALFAQVELARELHVPRHRGAIAGLLAMAFTIGGALLLAVVTIPLAPVQAVEAYWPLLSLVPLLLILLHPRMLNPVLSRLLRFARLPGLARPLRARAVARVAGWVLGTWLLFGLQAWLLVASITGVGVGAFPITAGAFALAFAAGFLLMLAPAGAGVREAVLVAALAPVLDPAGALVVALMSRALTALADLSAAGGGLLMSRRRAL